LGRVLPTVLLVSVSFDLLGLGNSGVGWLAAAIGIGGIAGGFYAVGLTRRRRLLATATVIALTDVRLAILGTADFLDALASSDDAYGIAWRMTTAMIDGHHAQQQT
jgi:hypothetical protein